MSKTADAAALAPVDELEARAISVEMYVYLYPLVLMDLTRRQMTSVAPGEIPGRGPMNTFAHVREFPAADFKAVVRPNFDTLYSLGWLDLTHGPVIVSTAGTNGRYYMLPMLDMWTDVFATPGKRTSGTHAQDFAVIPPGWHGELPHGAKQIDAPTPYVWIIGRTQTDGVSDYGAIRAIQDGYTMIPLSEIGHEPGPVTVEIDDSVDMETAPLDQVNAMPAADFFTYAAELMKFHPPHATDWSVLARAERIGLKRGQSLDWAALSPNVRDELESTPANALKVMQAKVPTVAPVVNGWIMSTDTMGVYGDYYLKRAIVAMIGLGANQPEDAVYPVNVADADGEPLNGDHDYIVHFTQQELPPVDAFWSVTMYDAQGFQAANAINRFAIGDRDPLTFNQDGSLDLYLQHEDPGDEKRTNWLPAPRGALGVTLRLYAPRQPVLQGHWAPPSITRA